MKNEPLNIVAEYKLEHCVVRIADNGYRDLTPGQIEANRRNARAIACQIIENAAASGIKV